MSGVSNGGEVRGTPMSPLRERVVEMTEEYWASRDSLSERVAVAQLILALARTEHERDEALGVLNATGMVGDRGF